jgi:uridine kinase
MDTPGLDEVVGRVCEARVLVPSRESMLVAVSGIDGAGKGHVSELLRTALAGHGLRAGVIGIDGWLNLPHVRFAESRPAEHFYRHAIRFDALFEQLVLPLRSRRSIRLEADFTEETASHYRKHVYEYHDVDVILLEGIFLLKRAFLVHYDLSVWIDCSFATALERALARAQEGLSREQTLAGYRTIYFPAQEIHFALDRPREAVTLEIANDPRLT